MITITQNVPYLAFQSNSEAVLAV